MAAEGRGTPVPNDGLGDPGIVARTDFYQRVVSEEWDLLMAEIESPTSDDSISTGNHDHPEERA